MDGWRVVKSSMECNGERPRTLAVGRQGIVFGVSCQTEFGHRLT